MWNILKKKLGQMHGGEDIWEGATGAKIVTDLPIVTYLKGLQIF